MTIIINSVWFFLFQLMQIICSAFYITPSVTKNNCCHIQKPILHQSLSNNGVHDLKNNESNRNNNNNTSHDLDEKIRYRGRVAYNGNAFKGWQIQAKGRTVQGTLESTLSQRFNRNIKIVGSGRTDSGVHARGQAFHFDLSSDETILHVQRVTRSSSSSDNNENSSISTTNNNDQEYFCQHLQKSLNSMLPQDIRIYNISECPPPTKVLKILPDGQESIRYHKWHAIYNAQRKLYVYRLSFNTQHARLTNDPLQRYTRVHIDDTIDIYYLQKVLQYFIGTHDFRAFAGAIEANMKKDGLESKDTIRTVYNVTLLPDGEEGCYRIEILLKGALYKMVRNMVGTALDVCRGRLKEEEMLRLLLHDNNDDGDKSESNGQRRFVRKDNKCKPAPPEGLTLEMVYFDDESGF